MTCDNPKLRPMTIQRACRVCGCTNDRACIDPRTGQPCYWVRPFLCSACKQPTAQVAA